jgi:hypothetical protein
MWRAKYLTWGIRVDGSSTERLIVSISRPLLSKKAYAGDDRLSAGRTVDQNLRSHAARNAALASSRVSVTPPFGPCVGWNIPLCVHRHSSRPAVRTR